MNRFSSKKSKNPKVRKLLNDRDHLKREMKTHFDGLTRFNYENDIKHVKALIGLIKIIESFDNDKRVNVDIIDWLLTDGFYPTFNTIMNNDPRPEDWVQDGEEFEQLVEKWNANLDECRKAFHLTLAGLAKGGLTLMGAGDVSATTLATSTGDITNEFDLIFSKTFNYDQSSILAKFGTGLHTKLDDVDKRVKNLEKLANSHRRVRFEENEKTKRITEEMLTFNIESPNDKPQILHSSFVHVFKNCPFVLQWNVSNTPNQRWTIWFEYGSYTTNKFTILVDDKGYTIDDGEASTFCEDEIKCAEYVLGMVTDWVDSTKQ